MGKSIIYVSLAGVLIMGSLVGYNANQQYKKNHLNSEKLIKAKELSASNKKNSQKLIHLHEKLTLDNLNKANATLIKMANLASVTKKESNQKIVDGDHILFIKEIKKQEHALMNHNNLNFDDNKKAFDNFSQQISGYSSLTKDEINSLKNKIANDKKKFISTYESNEINKQQTETNESDDATVNSINIPIESTPQAAVTEQPVQASSEPTPNQQPAPSYSESTSNAQPAPSYSAPTPNQQPATSTPAYQAPTQATPNSVTPDPAPKPSAPASTGNGRTLNAYDENGNLTSTSDLTLGNGKGTVTHNGNTEFEFGW